MMRLRFCYELMILVYCYFYHLWLADFWVLTLVTKAHWSKDILHQGNKQPVGEGQFLSPTPKGWNMRIQINKQIYKNIRAQAKQCFFVFCFYSSYRILYHPQQLVWFFSSTVQLSAVQCLSSNSRCLSNLQMKREKCYGLDVQRQGIYAQKRAI